MNYLGIDPGVTGGIALLSDDNPPLCWKMPDTVEGVVALLKAIPKDTYAVLERVYSSPQMGVVSAFTFGKGAGVLEAMMYAMDFDHSFRIVTPVKWQVKMGCLTGGYKKVSKAKAVELFPKKLFPKLKVTLATADALLLAEYARLTYGVTPSSVSLPARSKKPPSALCPF